MRSIPSHLLHIVILAFFVYIWANLKRFDSSRGVCYNLRPEGKLKGESHIHPSIHADTDYYFSWSTCIYRACLVGDMGELPGKKGYLRVFWRKRRGCSLPIFFAFSINMYKRHTNVQITRLAKPKEKEERNATTGSLSTNLGALRCFSWPWYTPSQDPPWELLSSQLEK